MGAVAGREFVVSFSTFLETVHPADTDAFLKEQKLFYSSKKTFNLEYRIILPDGTIRWVYEKGNLLEDEEGNAIIFQGMVQDITEQKQLSYNRSKKVTGVTTMLLKLPLMPYGIGI